MINAGRVAIVPKGSFVLGTQYTRLDLVTHENSAYMAIKNNINIPLTDSENWMLIVAGGVSTMVISDSEPDDVASGMVWVGD